MVTAADIREELDNCKKPLFFYDDDADGLCAFLLLYRYKKEGKGMVIKESAAMDEKYAQKVEEYQPDKVFILDIALVTLELINKIKVPVVWIDHHPPQEYGKAKYLNPRMQNPDINYPTTNLAYDIVQNPKDIWIAMTGCTGDWTFQKPIVEEFRKQYPELLPKEINSPEGALFGSKIGEMAKIFNFLLKEKIDELYKCVKILTRIQSPQEIFDQTTSQGKFIYKKYEQSISLYNNLLARAEREVYDDPFIIFKYTGDNSFTSELSNEMLYKHPDKIVLIAREKNGEMKCSLRSGKNYHARNLLDKSLVGIMGRGGGHDHACGVGVMKEHWEQFLQNLRDNLESAKIL